MWETEIHYQKSNRRRKFLFELQAICENEDETLKTSSETLIHHLASLHGAIEISEKYCGLFFFIDNFYF